MMLDLGAANGWQVTISANSTEHFGPNGLNAFDVLVFNNPNSTPGSGALLNATERAEFQRFIRAGGGWVGWHAASACERDWTWYEDLVGGIFTYHPAPQDADIFVQTTAHASVSHLPATWPRFEEWYNFTRNP